MKICVISTTIMPCPPSGYSGLEMLAWQQAVGLADKGHKVTLIAPVGSTVPDNVELHQTQIRESERTACSGYWHKLKDFDCIIDNSWEKWAYILKLESKVTVPILGVLHAPVNTMYNSPPPVEKPCLVAISRDQAAHVQEHLKVEAMHCYNGVDTEFYKPNGRIRSDRYLFLARMSSIKGPDIAVAVAKNCNVGLDVVGDDKLTAEPDLTAFVYNQCTLSPGLRYIGEQPRTECAMWFNRNKALLHPNMRFREPFGLAPVEAQLCGMPVIAWDQGAMRETIKHKETGFLVNSQEEIEELIRTDAVSSINPERCREWAMQFSYEAMVDRYEELCGKAVDGGW
jgi:glycosyltransferase involved in cell wall biosynthesis